MKPYIADADFTLYQGDALEVLRELPEASVHCCVTSPPYWALRDYGVAGQIGLERTPAEYVERLVEIFAAVARVLRDDGTLWLNLGDSYAAKARGSDLGWDKSRLTNPGTQQKARAASMRRTGERHRGQEAGLKNKDLCMIPARVALALQEDGWYLRSQIVWSKSNPMPESVTDRPTTSHEFVYLLTKRPRYYFDQDAVREPFGPHGPTPWGKNERERDRGGRSDGFTSGTGTGWTPAGYEPPRPQDETLDGSNGEAPRGPDGRRVTHVEGREGSLQHRNGDRWPAAGRNLRSVWEIPTQPYVEAHFATFPEELVRRCILAGSSERGCCPECGAAWVREVESSYDAEGRTTNGPRSIERRHAEFGSAGFAQRLVKSTSTVGWLPPPCGHDLAPAPATVLDPFGGSGTTAVVARKHGRRSILIELSPDYCRLAGERLSQQSLLTEATA